MEPLARYLAQVDRSDPDGCWPWTGPLFHHGYGSFTIGSRTDGTRRSVRPNRWGYEALVGPIPDGLNVLHRCDNPPCQRPDHWFLGTTQDNADDMVAKQRQARGVSHGRAKLTEDDVITIRQRFAMGDVTKQSLADEFGVHRGQIMRVLNGELWAHV